MQLSKLDFHQDIRAGITVFLEKAVESLTTKSSVNNGFTQHFPYKCSLMFSWGVILMVTQRKLCLSHLLNYGQNWMKYHQKKYRIVNLKKISHNSFNSFFLSCQFKEYEECCQ